MKNQHTSKHLAKETLDHFSQVESDPEFGEESVVTKIGDK